MLNNHMWFILLVFKHHVQIAKHGLHVTTQRQSGLVYPMPLFPRNRGGGRGSNNSGIGIARI